MEGFMRGTGERVRVRVSGGGGAAALKPYKAVS